MAMTGWSTTPASNATVGAINWAEGMAPSAVNDSARATMADVKAEWYQAADLSSSSTTAIGAAVGGYMKILGTTTITAFDTVDKGIRRRIHFGGALILTHGATLILPGGANITTVAGDTAEFMSEGSGTWRCLWYNGQNAFVSGNLTVAGLIAVGTGHISVGVRTTAITTAKNIYTMANAASDIAVLIVAGTNNVDASFVDLVAFVNGGTPVVISSGTSAGTPAARTYTTSTSTLRLAMASGTYSCRVMPFEIY